MLKCHRFFFLFSSCSSSLNVTKDANLTKGAFGICDRLANKTAKTTSMSNIYTTGDAAKQGVSSVIMFFTLLYFIQHLRYF